ncbi:Endoglin [Dirofilaria immitis]
MHCMVVLSLFFQLLLYVQVHLCQKAKKIAEAAKDTEQIVVRGSFASPACCESPWKFDSGTGQCILDMMAQGVKEQDMALLCTEVGFELEDGNCIRYVRLSYKYEITDY